MPSNLRTLLIVLWIAAALLSVAAGVIHYVKHGEFELGLVLPGLVLSGIGVTVAARAKPGAREDERRGAP